MKCIICHLDINEESEESEMCPNEHSAHSECLKEWLKHSKKCPLCRDSYDKSIIDKFKSYLAEEEAKVQEVLRKQKEEESRKEIKRIGAQMVFLKFIETIDNLINVKDYEGALERLESIDSNINTDKGRNIIFLKGKINYLMGRYDLAINFLFKLVKEKFDYPQAFYYLGKSYEQLGLKEKAKWAFERVPQKESIS
ncbi:MAG: hypothetical protein EU548_02325 [Promethearchaeota archaeon]|nr:MAG: hypothetical protein EU548_02325 [Candidatus Lokiarchaeota archaeon]